MKNFYLFSILFTLCLSGRAQSWQDTIAQIEKIFERYKPGKPGAQLAVSRHGKIIFSKAWGMADLEHNVPLTTESITEAGSVSKQFTCAAILLLEQQGKLSIDDDVRKYIPELPDYGYRITLRQMMQHKSGLKDWGSIAAISGWPRTTKTYNNDDALYIACNQKTLNHKPGDEYIYSNSNYNLLSIIILRVSGMSLAEYTRKYIFEPAGMKHTQWRDDYKRIVPNRAMAYSRSGSGHETNMPNEYVYGNGGLLTTAEDLVTWSHYFLTGKFGTPSLLEKQLSKSALNNGVVHRYAAGLYVDKYRGWDYVAHEGATAGYRSHYEAYRELGLAIAFLSNTSEFENDTLNAGAAVGDLFVPVKVPEPVQQAPKPFTVSKEKLKSYTGWYRNTRSGEGLKLSLQNEKLYASRAGLLTPVTENVFVTANNNRVEINSKRVLVIGRELDSTYFNKVDSAKLDERAMNEYAGEYYSDEAEAKIYIQVKNGKLVMLQKPKPGISLTPTYKDGFNIPDTPGVDYDGAIYFERDNNKIINFKISVDRARNVEFRKIK